MGFWLSMHCTVYNMFMGYSYGLSATKCATCSKISRLSTVSVRRFQNGSGISIMKFAMYAVDTMDTKLSTVKKDITELVPYPLMTQGVIVPSIY
jgi:hypothetical protein